jgi:hypothetical protein
MDNLRINLEKRYKEIDELRIQWEKIEREETIKRRNEFIKALKIYNLTMSLTTRLMRHKRDYIDCMEELEEKFKNKKIEEIKIENDENIIEI